MERMQPDDVPVGPDTRMGRNETEKEEHDACQSRKEKQQAVDHPQVTSFAPFPSRQKQDDGEQEPTAQISDSPCWEARSSLRMMRE